MKFINQSPYVFKELQKIRVKLGEKTIFNLSFDIFKDNDVHNL